MPPLLLVAPNLFFATFAAFVIWKLNWELSKSQRVKEQGLENSRVYTQIVLVLGSP